jgi:hypothetical protein
MIGWQYPAALWALALAALPGVIHLLRTHHARRVAFPSLRFVPSSRAAAVRVRLPSDIILMLLRIGILALAVAALARPIALTESRTSAWNARTARAVVVDISPSMRRPDATGATPDAAADAAAAAELQTAAFAHRIDASRLDDGLRRAARWLAASPPARREIVVISDLQRGALSLADADAVSDGIGIRIVPAGRLADRSVVAGARLLGADGVAAHQQRIEAAAETTAVVLEVARDQSTTGLRLLSSPDDERAVAGLLRAVASAGAPAGAADQPLAIRFAGAQAPLARPAAALQPGWMLRTVLRMRDDPSLADGAAGDPGDAVDGWTPVARPRDGTASVRAAAIAGELVLDVGARPDSFFAAAVVRAALTARVDPETYAEFEVARGSPSGLASMARPPGPVASGAWRNAEVSDARWLWLLALVGLAFEQWLRSRVLQSGREEASRAA